MPRRKDRNDNTQPIEIIRPRPAHELAYYHTWHSDGPTTRTPTIPIPKIDPKKE